MGFLIGLLNGVYGTCVRTGFLVQLQGTGLARRGSNGQVVQDKAGQGSRMVSGMQQEA